MIDKTGSFLSASAIALTLTFSAFAASLAAAQDTAALKELAQQADKEGVLRLSWSQSTLAAARARSSSKPRINKHFGTKHSHRLRAGRRHGADRQPARDRIFRPSRPRMWISGSALPPRLLRWCASTSSKRSIGRVISTRRWPIALRRAGQQYRAHRHRPLRRHLQFPPGADQADHNGRFPRRNGRARSPRRPMPRVSMFSLRTTCGARTRPSIMCGSLMANHRPDSLRRIAERIATGEFLALVMDCTGQDAKVWQERGAPIEQMVPLDAAQHRYYYFGVPKHARRPGAAKLFTAFFLSPEGQKIAWRHLEDRSAFLPGSHMASKFGYSREGGRGVQGGHRGMVAEASRDRRAEARPDQDFHGPLTTAGGPLIRRGPPFVAAG